MLYCILCGAVFYSVLYCILWVAVYYRVLYCILWGAGVHCNPRVSRAPVSFLNCRAVPTSSLSPAAQSTDPEPLESSELEVFTSLYSTRCVDFLCVCVMVEAVIAC